MMNELISVIVPVYNIENYLPRCLHALSEQTYKNLEILLVDDGSTDSSGAICDDFAAKDSRVRVIHKPNEGAWSARNVGKEASRGDYLFFPDGDDFFHQDLLSILLEAIHRGDGYDMAICRIKETNGEESEASSPLSVVYSTKTQKDFYFDLLYEKGDSRFAVFLWNKLFRRSLIENLRFNPLPVAEDLDFFIRLFPRIKEVTLVENTLYYWIQRPGSLTHNDRSAILNGFCSARVYYRNYLALSEKEKTYSPFLLERLYVRMLFLRHHVWNSPERKDAFAECDFMAQTTRKAFLFCRKLPLWKRVAYMILFYCPSLTHWLMKISRN